MGIGTMVMLTSCGDPTGLGDTPPVDPPIVFMREEGDDWEVSLVESIRPDGPDRVSLMKRAAAKEPGRSPDGKWLAYSRDTGTGTSTRVEGGHDASRAGDTRGSGEKRRIHLHPLPTPLQPPTLLTHRPSAATNGII